MRRIFIVALFFASGAVAAPPDIGPLPPLNFTPPKPERRELSNGVVVYLLEDHELPVFDLNMRIKVSPADEPPGRPFSLSFMGSVWRSGGTKKRPPDVLNQELEQMAASVETSAGFEEASISVSCLSRDIEKALHIFADILMNPQFSNDQLELAKQKSLEEIRRKNDTPRSIGSRALRDVIYGPTHIYALNPTPEMVRNIKRKNLVELHKKVIVPDGAIMAVAGNFNADELIDLLERHFSKWKPSGRRIPRYDFSPRDALSGKIFYVEKDFDQTRIYLGRLGFPRHSPEHFPMEISNYILGGGGASRLFGQIRSRLGLAYVVGSFFDEQTGPGLVGVGCQTKPASTLAALKALKRELDRFVKKPATEDEILLAKEALSNAFVFRFSSSYGIVSERASLDFYGYPADYLDTYLPKLDKVPTEDVHAISKKYFSPDGMRAVVVGHKKKFDGALSGMGEVVEIPLEKID